MPPTTYRKKAADLLALADVRLNGDRPWDMQVHNEDLYARVFSKGSVGLGEAYMDGWWDTQELDTLFDKILRAELEKKVTPLNILFHALTARLSNLQTKSHSVKVAKEHYDIGKNLIIGDLDSAVRGKLSESRVTKTQLEVAVKINFRHF
jgi:cyclopropane-fatty-acyl-phospholipid synthase